MNTKTQGTCAHFEDGTSDRHKGVRALLRLSSLIPLVLGACVLLPATSSPVQAKELSMQDNQGQYQPYTPGMKLPEGVYPPMQGYTHADLIEAAAKPAEALLKADGMDPTLIKETLIALAGNFNKVLEEKLVEYRLAKMYEQTKGDSAERSVVFSQVAESCGAMAMRAAIESLRGSPLLNKNDEFLDRYTSSAGDGVHDLVIKLSKPAP